MLGAALTCVAVIGTAAVTERGSRLPEGSGFSTRGPDPSAKPRSVTVGSAPVANATSTQSEASRVGNERVSGADRCRVARKGLRWYRGWFAYWTHKMGAALSGEASRAKTRPAAPCPRYLSKVFRAKAHTARKQYLHWRWYHYAWWDWLPLNWQNLGACETGYGRRPGNFEHSNSRFTSAFGISWAEYNADAAYFGSPPWHVRHTPRDQYNAARGHLARFGDGWTCPGP